MNLPNGNTANVFEQDSNPDRCHSMPSFLVTSSTVPAAPVLPCSNGGHPEGRQTSPVTISFLKAGKMGADTRNLWPGISKSGGSSRQGTPGDEYSLRTVDMQAKAKTIFKPGQLLTPSLFLLDAEALRKEASTYSLAAHILKYYLVTRESCVSPPSAWENLIVLG